MLGIRLRMASPPDPLGAGKTTGAGRTTGDVPALEDGPALPIFVNQSQNAIAIMDLTSLARYANDGSVDESDLGQQTRRRMCLLGDRME